ncbi:hypothetical protein HYFRA_00007979 [Hymenoscyphus fraxineus]|uniref:Uncharacterized protein n=1 Tax=Hymenoscyphus fraxineus TaxID=746836 RepID=A0A9N9PR84_9HELO|nr:hypothetical protein HYFRA_00007979 [Hymenoscyphus fraxineus]
MQLSTIFLTMGLLSITMAQIQEPDYKKPAPGTFPEDCIGSTAVCVEVCKPDRQVGDTCSFEGGVYKADCKCKK